MANIIRAIEGIGISIHLGLVVCSSPSMGGYRESYYTNLQTWPKGNCVAAIETLVDRFQ